VFEEEEEEEIERSGEVWRDAAVARGVSHVLVEGWPPYLHGGLQGTWPGTVQQRVRATLRPGTRYGAR
jgi:hypothetical protein